MEKNPNLNKTNIIKNYNRRAKVKIKNKIKTQLEILKTLPDSIYFNINDPTSNFKEEDLEKIYELIEDAGNGKSFLKEINNKNEFKNPEYLQVNFFDD